MEPTPEEAADGSILVQVLAAVLERLVNTNKSTARSDPGQVTKFHALKAPGIGVEAYLVRVHKYASCSNECFILALIYIDRLIERNNFLLTELNVHRVVITAILLAAKFFDDAYYNNAYYAKVGGVLVSELNGLEVDFLFRINFSLHVQPEVFEKYKAELVSHSINLIPGHITPSIASCQQLPHIPEVDPGSRTSNAMGRTVESSIETTRQREQEHPQSRMQTTLIDPANHDCVMVARPQVTPSPSNTSEDISCVTNNAMNVNCSTQTTSTFVDPTMQASMVEQTDELMATRSAANAASHEPIQNIPTIANKSYTQHHAQQTLLLQRANSLPQFSPGSCVNHAFKLPYSAPQMPATAPVMAVDQAQYRIMVSQLFPIENTLVHHNHQGVRTAAATTAAMQEHHATATASLVGHHPGLQAAALGPMAYEVGWGGQIR
mmetsp:Transcript_21795/g.46001  ORF Transcript_21795/g.46001 Transcript_21795/m.46001 type:complete len:436 (+) Transcript_21795:413-1720(+)